ncbi:unnamed protein product [Rhizophagus irregularis]|nr:unnamed protein product [Rhizophagus irregularis]CAB4483218.1 unnamed protein product [Rhizophagus irregularis]CAB5096821.1 unnamed protein product [Rhizophagus irregularis]CAB5146195.1 unnamed protein product [Rhizophagus irregularis]
MYHVHYIKKKDPVFEKILSRRVTPRITSDKINNQTNKSHEKKSTFLFPSSYPSPYFSHLFWCLVSLSVIFQALFLSPLDT